MIQPTRPPAHRRAPGRTPGRTPFTVVAATTSATLAGALLASAPLVAPAATAAVTGSATVSASYSCSVLGQRFDLPVDFSLTAAPSGRSTTLTASGGRPTLPLDAPLTITKVTSTLAAQVDGRPVTLSGTVPSLTATPNTPIDLPSLTGTVDVPGPTLTFSPGAFSMALTAYGFPASITCSLPGTAPTVTVGTASTSVDVPRTGELRTVPARLSLTPAAKSVKRKAVRKRGAKARVKITLKGPAQRRLEPVGTLVVTVGKKRIRTMRTTRATVLRVQLPRTLAPGKHRVRATFRPSGLAKSSGVGTVSRSVVVRVLK